MNNYTSIVFGGKERGVEFNLGSLDYIEEMTGEEPIQYTFGILTTKAFRKAAPVLVYAGLMSNCDSQNEKPDFTAEEVSLWAKKISLLDLVKVMNAFTAYRQGAADPAASEEGSGDTQVINVAGSNGSWPRKDEHAPLGV